MAEPFDIERFAQKIGEKHPELTTSNCEGEGTSHQNTFDEYEKNLVDEWPELALSICEFDEQTVREEKESKISKKQQARDRQARLEAMMTDGRSLYEKNKTFHDEMLASEGPMKLLADSVKGRKRIEVRTRSAVRMDRIFHGIPTTFDVHFNIMMSDVTETVLYGRKAQKEVGARKRLQQLLPSFLHWKEGGEWPLPIGSHRLIEHRFQRACFVKGDSVVLIRIL